MISKKCEFCEVDEAYNFHHLIPKTLHHNKWFKKRYTQEEMNIGLDVCKECHHMFHEAVPSEKELGRKYNTKESLMAHPKLSSYVNWKRSK